LTSKKYSINYPKCSSAPSPAAASSSALFTPKLPRPSHRAVSTRPPPPHTRLAYYLPNSPPTAPSQQRHLATSPTKLW
jgi:hypothetical protein